MSAERRESPPQDRPIPELPGREHIPDLIIHFLAEKNEDIVNARGGLLEALQYRGLKPKEVMHILEVAALAHWMHRKENRLTGEPYIVHPLAAATTLAENPYIKSSQLTSHIVEALGHDLFENTYIKRGEARSFAGASETKGILLLSKVVKSDNDSKKLDTKSYFDRILKKGKIREWRNKIADWEHNLRTTLQSTEGHLSEEQARIERQQGKFVQTPDLIFPLIRKFPEGEREWWYNRLKQTYEQYKPHDAPPLPPLNIF